MVDNEHETRKRILDFLHQSLTEGVDEFECIHALKTLEEIKAPESVEPLIALIERLRPVIGTGSFIQRDQYDLARHILAEIYKNLPTSAEGQEDDRDATD